MDENYQFAIEMENQVGQNGNLMKKEDTNKTTLLRQ
jgi:hypothetical protein